MDFAFRLGNFTRAQTSTSQCAEIQAVEGALAYTQLGLAEGGKSKPRVKLGSHEVAATVRAEGSGRTVAFGGELHVTPEAALTFKAALTLALREAASA